MTANAQRVISLCARVPSATARSVRPPLRRTARHPTGSSLDQSRGSRMYVVSHPDGVAALKLVVSVFGSALEQSAPRTRAPDGQKLAREQKHKAQRLHVERGSQASAVTACQRSQRCHPPCLRNVFMALPNSVMWWMSRYSSPVPGSVNRSMRSTTRCNSRRLNTPDTTPTASRPSGSRRSWT
jgi:hypothetical protein